MKKYLLFAILISVIANLNAQILQVPLGENPVLRNYEAPYITNQNLSKAPGDTIDIPFLDDFNYESLYPSKKYWEDEFVYVNKGFGVNPPTIGVATFDGVDNNGTAYANSGSGIADYMTSKPIYLGGKSATDNIYLSFFFQREGFGNRPEEQDSLVVEFKTNTGNWVSMARIVGDTASTVGFNTLFELRAIAINQTQYLYDGFQFRFKNYANLTGSLDHWNVDYVRITENTIPNTTFNDVAFMYPAQKLLENYTAMPWRHFKDNKATETKMDYRVDLDNHFSATQNINPSQVTIEANGIIILQDLILSFNEPPIALGNIPPGKHVVEKVYPEDQALALMTNLNLFDNEENLIVNSYFTINPSNQDGTLNATLKNDTAFSATIFSNYFAYDDGSAELAVVAGSLGDEVAVRFTANVPDTLKAIQLFIPRVAGDVGTQRFNIKVWIGDLNTTPAYRLDFVKPVYVDSLAGWTTYALDTLPLALPVGDFYIGWQQAIAPSNPNEAIPVGYDRNNNDKVVNNFMNIGGGWQPLNSGSSSLNDGALMIRAIVGETELFTSNTTSQNKEQIEATIYPNPTDNQLFVTLDGDYSAYQYRIVNVAGQILQNGILSQELNVASLPSGIYFINIRHQSENINLNYKFVKK
jgi:hypothetical protein